MKSLGKILLTVGLFSSLLVGRAQAADGGANQINLHLGAAFPTSANDFSDSAETGIGGGVQYLRHTSDCCAFGFKTGYFGFPGKNRTLVLPNGRLTADSDSMAMTYELTGRYKFSADRKVAPYLSAGAGLTHFSQETKGTPQNGTTWSDTGTREERTVADDSSTGYAVSFGAGLEMAFASRMTAAFEVNWHIFGVDNDKFGTSAINVPSAAFLVGYRF